MAAPASKAGYGLPKDTPAQVAKGDEEEEKGYVGFGKLKTKLGKKGAKDPGALAAWIGRNKYGKTKFQGYAAKDKKMRSAAKKAMDELEEKAFEGNEKMRSKGILSGPKVPPVTGAASAAKLNAPGMASLKEANKKNPDSPFGKALSTKSFPVTNRSKFDHYDQTRMTNSVMTRDNSKFAKDYNFHTGPLTPETIKLTEEESERRTHQKDGIYKSCICGRTYLAKSEVDDCPSCSVWKSQLCKKCGNSLMKTKDGSLFCEKCI